MKSRFILKPVAQPTAPFQDTFTLMFIVGIPSSWRNQFTNYLYNLSAAGWCSHIRGIQAWAYVCVSVEMKLAVLSYSFAHLYNFSPWWSIPFREMLLYVHPIWCFALRSFSCCWEGSWDVNWSYWKKCEYIVIICDVLDAESTQQRRHVSLYRFLMVMQPGDYLY